MKGRVKLSRRSVEIAAPPAILFGLAALLVGGLLGTRVEVAFGVGGIIGALLMAESIAFALRDL